MDARSLAARICAALFALQAGSFHPAAAQPLVRVTAEMPAVPMFAAESHSFTVLAPDPRLAGEVARLAEHYRRELALQWLGHELPAWRERCPIRVEIAPHAGGETTFAFVSGQTRSEPTGWSMRVFGPPERILDAVLPHEVTHTIFATHFGRPLPRWADEGACTTVEHSSERDKIQRLLVEYLSARPSRGLPFNRMFTMMQYPQNPDGMLPLYAQSYSLARFLILQGGHQHFVKFVGAGLAGESVRPPLEAWNQATRSFYGYEDLSELQIAWIAWVAAGSREDIQPAALAAGHPERPAATLVAQVADSRSPLDRPVDPPSPPEEPPSGLHPGISQLPGDSWYRQALLHR